MDTLNARLDKLMPQACLNATAGQQSPAPSPASNPMVLDKPQPFYGTRGAAAKAFVVQIGFQAITYPECFPTNTSKVVLSSTWTRSPAMGNWWSLMTSSMISNRASLITTASTVPRWPCVVELI
ncbi:uncharacterized protein VP01_5988g1 [Puccinia sorghi]|uniref:Uncharacterized protein n=1 Tax=Puccinia sorghi TaxID=27349 RepID=A0A0L6UHK6_9BASI|nr:uncharacterized protein VP01_5988g1 [Puccinia sorghi]